MEHDLNILMIFGIKENDNFDPYNILLAIATNIPAYNECFCAPATHRPCKQKKNMH